MRHLMTSMTLASLMLVLAFSVSAEQKITKGDWDIHYIVFPSSFREPEVARTYNLERSKYKSVVNISVLDNGKKNEAQTVHVTGTARNQLGQTKVLEFDRIREDKAIYYLSQLKHIDREVYNFEIKVQRGDRVETLKFQQKLYVE